MKKDLIILLYFLKKNPHHYTKMDKLIIKSLQKFLLSKEIKKLGPEEWISSRQFSIFLGPKAKEQIEAYYTENQSLASTQQSIVWQFLSQGESLITCANEEKLAQLPSELWLELFSYLTPEELKVASSTCKFFLPFRKDQALRHMIAKRSALDYCQPILSENKSPICASQKIEKFSDCIAVAENLIAVATKKCIQIIYVDPDSNSFILRRQLKYKEKSTSEPKLIKISNTLLAIRDKYRGYTGFFSSRPYSDVQVFDWQKGTSEKVIKHPEYISDLAMHKNTLFSVDIRGRYYNCSQTSKYQFKKLRQDEEEFSKFLVLDDGRMVTKYLDETYASNNITIKTKEGKPLATFRVKYDTHFCISADQKYMAFTKNKHIKLISLDNYQLVKLIKNDDYSPFGKIISLSDKILATYGRSEKQKSKSTFILIWDLQSGKCLNPLDTGKKDLKTLVKLSDGRIIFYDEKTKTLNLSSFHRLTLDSEKEQPLCLSNETSMRI